MSNPLSRAMSHFDRPHTNRIPIPLITSLRVLLGWVDAPKETDVDRPKPVVLRERPS
jgi:hypothetical protein